MRTVVTGASGHIGKRVVQRLKARGQDVAALSRTSTPGTFVCLVAGRKGPLEAHMEGVSSVIHLAGQLVENREASIGDYLPANVVFTDEVLEAAANAGVQNFVHASSRLVYPSDLISPAVEKGDAAPDTPYGLSKLWAEDLVRSASKKHGFSAVSLRIGQVTGGEHHGLGVLNSFIDQSLRDGVITVHGEGRAVREFIHVEDVADALIAATEYNGPWLSLNLGNADPVTIWQLAERVAVLSPQSTRLTHRGAVAEDSSVYALSSARTKSVLDWTPKRDVDDIVVESLQRRARST